MAVAHSEPNPTSNIPEIPGIPLIGNTFEMAKDPAAFFVRCYKEYGPVFRINVFGRKSYVIAGVEAAKLMSTKKGREGLRSKEFWKDFVDHYGASKTLTQIDGEQHRKLRAVMRAGFSKDAVAGRYHELAQFIDLSIERDWSVDKDVPVVEAFQYMIVHIIGEIMSGKAPLEYVRDIRINILYLLNILVTRQRPKFFLKFPEFKKASSRVDELGEQLIKEFREHADNGTLPKNLLGDVMKAHIEDPELVEERDLAVLLTGPYVAGLDTVANTLAACVYGILKTPGVLKRVKTEADALFKKGSVAEADLGELSAINGAIKEAMRLWPIAVAQMRTTTCDLEFEGHVIPKDEMIYIGTSVPHFMDDYFSDAAKFDIDRYLPERAEHMKPGVFSPFGRGPHTCLGQNLAEVLMGICIARLFHRLDLSLDPPDYVLKTKSAPTPGPAMSFAVKVKKQRRKAKALTPEAQVEEETAV